MYLMKRVTSAFDSEINSFTKKLQRNRGLQIGPNGTAQGFFYRIGIEPLGNAVSPEAALARALKEWVSLRRWDLGTQTSLIEVRVFGNKYVKPDRISSLEEFFAWRLPLAFPDHSFAAINGWTPGFYAWAMAKAEDHF